jgi:hypothetical protein
MEFLRLVLRRDLPNMHLMGRRYRPTPYNGRVVLFDAAAARSADILTRSSGWGRPISGEFDVAVVESDHDDMFDEPQVQHVAAELAARLGGSGYSDQQSARTWLRDITVAASRKRYLNIETALKARGAQV